MATKDPDIHYTTYYAALKRRGFQHVSKRMVKCPCGLILHLDRSPKQTNRGLLAWLIRQDRKWTKRIKNHRVKHS